ncbi:hypothetical protein [Paraburkholderia sp. J10-1]|uniref:hypothetical protein n=1 Tax=Paraburkholderia sp. J10-1 TaxID=2805430 RepID=UPI0039EF8E38
MTQAAFAAHRGVSVRTIQDLERGGDASIESLNRIVSRFGLEARPVPGGMPALARSPREAAPASHVPSPIPGLRNRRAEDCTCPIRTFVSLSSGTRSIPMAGTSWWVTFTAAFQCLTPSSPLAGSILHAIASLV